ncbi:Ribose ABC transporter, periplasmic ribose-binding protein RbsB [Caenispirillum salinarum AK4]|uniref:Ribose ABC transporter, periplasmic ribose-binding protein RbsB n=1 Tax=Caenispirillum salinarum AK4 TaxID=1238182 RepID=K9GYG6_9PROT|nr:substrate-binding domain-containing protein [Caenispirillum salinarum]EKV29809.1 Ribose ABC transporter, periplasmic ribose-binding protein RbsB [Caenispirillum salinarum AK4]
MTDAMKPGRSADRAGTSVLQRHVSRRTFAAGLGSVGGVCALFGSFISSTAVAAPDGVAAASPRLAYLVSDLRIPFWDIMWRGVRSEARQRSYAVEVLSAGNSPRDELSLLVQAIRQGVQGLIVSPTTSSACVTILDLAEKAGVPVVISDIGTDGGRYVSYISSDNETGAHGIGVILADAMAERGWLDGSVGIVAIPQKRANGQARTAGFMRAMEERAIRVSGIRQQVNFTYQETFDHASDLLRGDPSLRAIWLQGSDRYQGALDAIAAAGRTGEVLLVTFDAEPEFLDLIPQGVLVGAGMQQPFLMGEKAVAAMDRHLRGQAVERVRKLPVLTVSQDNIDALTPLIRRNVLGLTGAGKGR